MEERKREKGGRKVRRRKGKWRKGKDEREEKKAVEERDEKQVCWLLASLSVHTSGEH